MKYGSFENIAYCAMSSYTDKRTSSRDFTASWAARPRLFHSEGCILDTAGLSPTWDAIIITKLFLHL